LVVVVSEVARDIDHVFLGVVDPADTDGAWALALELFAKLEEFSEVGYRTFGVRGVGGEVGEALLDADDGGFDRGYKALRGQVFARRTRSGVGLHDRNLAGGAGVEWGGIF